VTGVVCGWNIVPQNLGVPRLRDYERTTTLTRNEFS